MKNLCIFVAIVAIMMTITSCKKNIDPIWGTVPVDTALTAHFPLERFHQLGIAGDTAAQKALVNQCRKQLSYNIMGKYPCIKDSKNILFVLGSGFADSVLSGDGKKYSGKFDNELIIILTDSCIKDTLFLACGNGMTRPIRFKHRSDLGTAESCRFEIQPGQGLAHHLPKLQAWANIAGEVNIPIKNEKGKVVTSNTYLNYLGEYETLLFPGDIIDMCKNKAFNKFGQEIEFERRLSETRAANAEIAKAMKAKAKTKAKKGKKR